MVFAGQDHDDSLERQALNYGASMDIPEQLADEKIRLQRAISIINLKNKANLSIEDAIEDEAKVIRWTRRLIQIDNAIYNYINNIDVQQVSSAK